jgi:hypothetical protein
MTHNNILVAILGLLSAFSAFGGEKQQPSTVQRIAKSACIGICGGPLVYTFTKGYLTKDHPDVRFSQEDLFPIVASSIAGLIVSTSVGEIHHWHNQRKRSRQIMPMRQIDLSKIDSPCKPEIE